MGNTEDYLRLLAEEYRTVRDECLLCLTNMLNSMKWGAAVVGLVLGGAFTQWNKQHAVVLLAFLVAVPLLSAMSCSLWLGEALRLKRTGSYLTLIEQKAAIVVCRPESWWASRLRTWQESNKDHPLLSEIQLDMGAPLVWEQWLRSKKGKGGHLPVVYLARLAFFPVVAAFSLLTGIYYSVTHPKFSPERFVPLSGLVPEPKDAAAILIVGGLLVLLFLSVMAAVIAWDLNRSFIPTTLPNLREMSTGTQPGPHSDHHPDY